jgi:hypothetical protein
MEGKRSEIILYETPDGKTHLDVLLEGETVWLTQTQIGELFTNQNPQLASILIMCLKRANWKKMQLFGNSEQLPLTEKAYDVNYYNLDVIISVGYRVKSPVGTQFRIWANKVLRELIIKGFVLDDARGNAPVYIGGSAGAGQNEYALKINRFNSRSSLSGSALKTKFQLCSYFATNERSNGSTAHPCLLTLQSHY